MDNSPANYQPPPMPNPPTSSPPQPPHNQHHHHPKPEHNLYTRSVLSIFWRNFIAGAAHALGGIILYLIFAAVVIRLISLYLIPPLEPLFRSFENISRLTTPPTTDQSQPVNTNQLNTLMERLNQIELPAIDTPDANSQFDSYNQ